MGRHSQSVDNQVWRRIQSHKAGWVFTPANFIDLGSRTAVATALKRYKQAGLIRQLDRGLYDVPKIHANLGQLTPSIEDIVKALAGRHAIRLQPSGAYAANLLRLSEQVPAKVVFLTDGPSRKVRIGKQEITLKQAAPRNLGASGRTSGLVIEALRYLGKENVNAERINHLRTLLSAKDKTQLLNDLPLAPTWMHSHLRYIAEDSNQ